MVDSINFPSDLGVIKIEVKDNKDVLRRFLTDLILRIEVLEQANTKLTEQINKLNESRN